MPSGNCALKLIKVLLNRNMLPDPVAVSVFAEQQHPFHPSGAVKPEFIYKIKFGKIRMSQKRKNASKMLLIQCAC